MKYKVFDCKHFADNPSDLLHSVIDTRSITAPMADITIQELMQNAVLYEQQERQDVSYAPENLSDEQVFSMVDLDNMDLAEVQELRDKVDEKVRKKFKVR